MGSIRQPDILGDMSRAIAMGEKLWGPKEAKEKSATELTSGSTNSKNEAMAGKYQAETIAVEEKLPLEKKKLGAEANKATAAAGKHKADAEKSKSEKKKVDLEAQRLEVENRKKNTTDAISGLYDSLLSLPQGSPVSKVAETLQHYQQIVDEKGEKFDLAATLQGDGGFASAHRMTEMIDDIRQMEQADTYEDGNGSWREQDEMRTAKLQGYKEEALKIIQNDPHMMKQIDRGSGGRKRLFDIVLGSDIDPSLPDDRLYVELEVTRPDGSVTYELMTKGRGTKEDGDNEAKPISLRDIQQYYYGEQKIAAALEPFRKVLQRREQEGYYNANVDPDTHKSNLKIGEDLVGKSADVRVSMEEEARKSLQGQIDGLNENGLADLRQMRAAEQAGGAAMSDEDRSALLALENQLDDYTVDHQIAMGAAQSSGGRYLSMADQIRNGAALPPGGALGSRAAGGAPVQDMTADVAVGDVSVMQPGGAGVTQPTAQEGSLEAMVGSTLANDRERAAEAENRQFSVEQERQQAENNSVSAETALTDLQAMDHALSMGQMTPDQAQAQIQKLNSIYALLQKNPALRERLNRATGAQSAEQYLIKMMRMLQQAGG